MNASVQAVRAITGVYFQKLITIGAGVGGILIALLWALLVWLTTSVDPLWGLFFIVLVPLTLAAVLIYRLLRLMGQSLIPRVLTKKEQKAVTTMGDKLFSVAETATTPWFINLFLVGKDVLRGRESSHVKNVIANTSGLKDDFLRVRALFE